MKQFYRSFPRPPEVTEEHVALLVSKYRDPDRPGLLNYLDLYHDLEDVSQKLDKDGPEATLQSTNSEYIFSQVNSHL